MYMRFIRMRVKEPAELRELYDRLIRPSLHATEGCLYATLIQGTDDRDEMISMTLWHRAWHAEAYERSPLYERLRQEVTPHLADAAEWKIRLADDLTLDRDGAKEEPSVEGYRVEAAEQEPAASKPPPGIYVRILSVRVRPGKFHELKQRYYEQVLPVLRKAAGCRHAFLMEGVQDRERVLSVTIWESERHARTYEESGAFDHLRERLKDTLSPLYRWKMPLAEATQLRVATRDDLDVSRYRFVAGDKL